MRILIALFLLLMTSSVLGHPLLLEDPSTLAVLEGQGLDFGSLLFSKSRANNSDLNSDPNYASLVADLEKDLEALKASDPKLGVGMKYVHRLFDIQWLRSSSARFELVGVVNRMDRRTFNPGSCGELRLIYRLAYKKNQTGSIISSRMPMTVNAVYRFPATQPCSDVAKAWSLKAEQLKVWLTQKNFKSLEVNLQATRWPSTIRGDMGGHAEYFLRVYRLDNGKLTSGTLENTPDVEKINAQPTLKAELRKWLQQADNIRKTDEGTLLIPEKFLATKATSVALHGMNRLANRPFDQIFTTQDFQDFKLQQLQYIYGPSSYRRRLNDLTCAGCHQGRTIAGFHFLGKDPTETLFANSIFSSRSPHMIEEQERREKYFQAVLSGVDPIDSRPFSERDPERPGIMNAHCGLQGSEYSKWKCTGDLFCKPIVLPSHSEEVGICLPEKPIAGTPCEPGTVSQKANSHKDTMTTRQRLSCAAGQVCQTTLVGFPGGMCSGTCENLGPGESCGSIAILQGFNDCLALQRPFGECLAQNTRPASLQACDEQTPCRADYICARTKEGRGTCIPPYFLFQLRVDGHPKAL